MVPRARIVIGVDEVGRGPIAGPVAVGAFAFLDPSARRLFRGVRESKQLSEAARERWFAVIERVKACGRVDFAVSFEDSDTIDRQGLTFAIGSALERSLGSIPVPPVRARVLLDGGLKAPSIYDDQMTIIRGDEKRIAIALASICAKVLRDRGMRELGRLHPAYGFERNKGYGTASHYAAISEHGLLHVHRKSFVGGDDVLAVAEVLSRGRQAGRS